MPITQEPLSVNYFVCPIPGANRCATSLRSCKNMPDVFVMSMDGGMSPMQERLAVTSFK